MQGQIIAKRKGIIIFAENGRRKDGFSFINIFNGAAMKTRNILLTLALIFIVSSFNLCFSQPIHFSAISPKVKNWIELDSVYIQNLSNGLDTAISGVYTIDLDVLSNIASNIIPEKDIFIYSSNIFEDALQFEIGLPDPENISIEIYDLHGNSICADNFFLSSGRHEFTFSASKLTSGIYFINIRGLMFIKTFKALKYKSQNGFLCEILYNGASKLIPIPKLLSEKDIYRFTGYTKGLLPETLDSIIPENNKNYEFNFLNRQINYDIQSLEIEIKGLNIIFKISKFNEIYGTEKYLDTINTNYKYLYKDSIINIWDRDMMECACEIVNNQGDTVSLCFEALIYPGEEQISKMTNMSMIIDTSLRKIKYLRLSNRSFQKDLNWDPTHTNKQFIAEFSDLDYEVSSANILECELKGNEVYEKMTNIYYSKYWEHLSTGGNELSSNSKKLKEVLKNNENVLVKLKILKK